MILHAKKVKRFWEVNVSTAYNLTYIFLFINFHNNYLGYNYSGHFSPPTKDDSNKRSGVFFNATVGRGWGIKN